MNSLAAMGIKHLKDMIMNKQIDSICMENHEEIISKLKFIGFLQKDEKIDVRHVHRQPNTLYTKLCRFFIYPDNRNNALKFIRDVLSRSFEIIDMYIHQNNLLVAKSIVTDVLRARQGILNFKYTYNEDTKFCCDLDVLIEIIASKLNTMKEQHPLLFEEKETKEKDTNKK